MTSSATLVASGRVPKAQKLRVDEKVRRMGFSPSDNILRMYEYMDTHETFPWLEEEIFDNATFMDEFDALVGKVPSDTDLATLSREDMKVRYRARV